MRIRMLVGTSLLLLALAGCASPATSMPAPPPSPSVTPLFASDEEALAAAEEAYAAYLEMSDRITADGGKDPERIAPFVTEQRLAAEVDGFSALRDRDLHTEGSTTFRALGLQRFDDRRVIFYACWNGSGVRVRDGSGEDATPVGLKTESTFEVEFESLGRDFY